LKVIIRDSVKLLSDDKTLPENVRSELSLLNLTTDEVIEIWEQLKPVFESFNGSAKKFYSKMFKIFASRHSTDFPQSTKAYFEFDNYRGYYCMFALSDEGERF